LTGRKIARSAPPLLRTCQPQPRTETRRGSGANWPAVTLSLNAILSHQTQTETPPGISEAWLAAALFGRPAADQVRASLHSAHQSGQDAPSSAFAFLLGGLVQAFEQAVAIVHPSVGSRSYSAAVGRGGGGPSDVIGSPFQPSRARRTAGAARSDLIVRGHHLYADRRPKLPPRKTVERSFVLLADAWPSWSFNQTHLVLGR
jgi:hypothetical protein